LPLISPAPTAFPASFAPSSSSLRLSCRHRTSWLVRSKTNAASIPIIEYVILFSKLTDAIQAPQPVVQPGARNEECNHDEYSPLWGSAFNGRAKSPMASMRRNGRGSVRQKTPQAKRRCLGSSNSYLGFAIRKVFLSVLEASARRRVLSLPQFLVQQRNGCAGCVLWQITCRAKRVSTQNDNEQNSVAARFSSHCFVWRFWSANSRS